MVTVAFSIGDKGFLLTEHLESAILDSKLFLVTGDIPGWSNQYCPSATNRSIANMAGDVTNSALVVSFGFCFG